MSNQIKEIENAIQSNNLEDLFCSFSEIYESSGGNFGTAIQIKNMGPDISDRLVKAAQNEEDLEYGKEEIYSLLEGIRDAFSLAELKDTIMNFISYATSSFSDEKEIKRVSKMAESAKETLASTLDPWIEEEDL